MTCWSFRHSCRSITVSPREFSSTLETHGHASVSSAPGRVLLLLTARRPPGRGCRPPVRQGRRPLRAASLDACYALDHGKLAGFFELRGCAMKCSKRSFAFVFVLFAVLLSSGAETLKARDADSASLTFWVAQT